MTTMRAHSRTNPPPNGERGSTLFIVAGCMVVLLGIGALAIDVGSLYVARSESQRAADAAALAGAKVFVESGCVTSGDCSSEESTARDRATQVALQNLVGGQAVTIGGVTFTETPQNPQITIKVQSSNLHVFFAGAIGITSAPNVSATATAEAYNPSGQAGGPSFCTGCVRPWLIPNCDGTYHTNSGCLLSRGSSSVADPGCGSGGVIGRSIQIASVEMSRPQFEAVDDGTGFDGYQKSIITCNTGQMTCGKWVNTLPKPRIAIPTPGVATLLHITSGSTGQGQGQDWIDPTVCPPQIHAGSLNPLVAQGVIAENALVTTSDSIVTVYLYNDNGTALNPNTSQSVQVHGF